MTQEEYYRLFAFLNNSHEANVAVYTPEEQMKRAEILREVREIEDDLRHRDPDWAEQMAAWEKQVANDQPAWTILRPEVEEESTGGEKNILMDDGSFLAQGYAPTKHTVEMSVKTDLTPITAFRLELLNDPNLPLGGPGRSIKGTAALTEFRVEAAPADAPEKTTKIKFIRATADIEPAGEAARRRSSTTRAARSASPARAASRSTARTRPPGAPTPVRDGATSRARRSSTPRSRSRSRAGRS